MNEQKYLDLQGLAYFYQTYVKPQLSKMLQTIETLNNQISNIKSCDCENT